MFRVLILLVFGLSPSTSTAQTVCNASGLDNVSLELLQKPIGVVDGYGTEFNDTRKTDVIKMSGSEDDAYNRLYSQGWSMFHAFQWVDSIRTFNDAIRINPELPMAYVGLTLSYLKLNGLEGAREALNKARRYQANHTTAERVALWINIAEANLAVRKSRVGIEFFSLYVSSFDKLIEDFGEFDVEARVVRGFDSLYRQASVQIGRSAAELSSLLHSSPNQQLQAMRQTIATLSQQIATKLEGDLRYVIENQDSDHAGAIHYLVHLTENSGRHSEAVIWAEKVVSVAPGSPHLQHMLGHVYPLVGRWEEAEIQFLKADEIHRQHISAGAKPEEYWHHSHNLELLGVTQYHLGKFTEAEKTLSERCDIMPFDSNCLSLVNFYLIQGEYDKAIAAVDKRLTKIMPADFDTPRLLIAQAQIGKSDTEVALETLKQIFGTSDVNSTLKAILSSRNPEAIVTYLMFEFIDNPEKAPPQALDETFQILQSLFASGPPNFDSWAHGLTNLRKFKNMLANKPVYTAFVSRISELELQIAPSLSAAAQP